MRTDGNSVKLRVQKSSRAHGQAVTLKEGLWQLRPDGPNVFICLGRAFTYESDMATLKKRRVNDAVVESIWRALLEVFDEDDGARNDPLEAARSLAEKLKMKSRPRRGRPRGKNIHPIVMTAVRRIQDMEAVHKTFIRLKRDFFQRVHIAEVADEFFGQSGLSLNHQIEAAILLRQNLYAWRRQNKERVRQLDSNAIPN